MAILETVKQALGIFYSEPTKDAEVSGIIAGVKAFMLSAGWPSADLAEDAETPEAIQAIVNYAKGAINTDPAETKISPIFIAMTVQARTATETTEESSDDEETDPTPEPDPDTDPADTDPVDGEGDGE